MHARDFNVVLDDQLAKATATLGSKAGEYATDDDRLSNFKKAAALEGKTQPQAVHGMMVKHLVSISDMVQSGEDYPMEVWEEKLGDAINYMILLKASVVEGLSHRDYDAVLEGFRENLYGTKG